MDVENPEAIKFVNEQVRPLCELARDLMARVNAMESEWFNGLNTTIGTSEDDAIADGREEEGVSRLTAADVTTAVANLLAARSAMGASVIELPCVRPLRVVTE